MAPATQKNKRTWLWIALACAALLMALCVCLVVVLGVVGYQRGWFDNVSRPGGMTVVVGAGGSTVDGPAGSRLAIPAGALTGETTFSLREAPEPPDIAAEYLASPAGPAIEIETPEGLLLADAAELTLPVNRYEGDDPRLYSVYRWDGSAWYDVGGILEGAAIRVNLDRFSLFQSFYGYSGRATIGFANSGPYNAMVEVWSWIPLDSRTPAPPPTASTVSFAPGGGGLWPNSSRFLSLPYGAYQFCVQYESAPGEYWHYILGADTPIGLGPGDPDDPDLAADIGISTEGGPGTERGPCPSSRPVTSAGSAGGPISGAPGAGAVTVRLSWSTIDDLDLHVIEPSGEEIFFGSRISSSGGQLDVDSNAVCSTPTTSPVENVFWPASGAPRGNYSVRVHVWSDCDNIPPVEFRLRVMSDGSVVYDSSGVLEGDGDEFIYTFSR